MPRDNRYVSVTRATYVRMLIFCTQHDIAMAALVEYAVAPVVDGIEPRSLASRSERETRIELAPMPPRWFPPCRDAGLSARVQLNVSARLAEDVRVAVERTGRSPEQELELALLAMLDHAARSPWCRVCCEAIEFCRCRVARTSHLR
jgi:hypothetical protein